MIELRDAAQVKTLLDRGHIFILKVFTPSCGPCKALQPELEKLEKEEKVKRLGVGFYSIDATQNPDFVREYGIMSVPYSIIFRDGQMTYSIYGFTPKLTVDKIREKLFKTQDSN